LQTATVSLALPSDLTWTLPNYTAPTGFTCSGTSTISCSGGADAILMSGDSTFTFSVDVGVAASGAEGLTGSVGAAAKVDASNNQSGATVNVAAAPQADLSVSIDDGSATIVPGTQATYTIIAASPPGASGVTDATVTATFPAQFSAITWTCTP